MTLSYQVLFTIQKIFIQPNKHYCFRYLLTSQQTIVYQLLVWNRFRYPEDLTYEIELFNEKD